MAKAFQKTYQTREIIKGLDARNYIVQGMKLLATTVGITLGPQGRNVVIDYEAGQPKITKDGVTVAKHITLSHRAQNIGTLLLQKAANSTNEFAGDGTTTTTLMAGKLIEKGIQYLNKGAHPLFIQKGIKDSAEFVNQYLKAIARPIADPQELYKIILNSSNNDHDLSQMVLEVMVENQGKVEIMEGSLPYTKLFKTNGMELHRGYASKSFIKGPHNDVVLTNPKILIYKHKLHAIKPLLPVLEYCKKHNFSLLVLAEDIDHQALSTMLLNKQVIDCCAICFPGIADTNKEWLEDVAAYTGGIAQEFDTFNIDELGSVKEVQVYENRSVFLQGNEANSQKRREIIEKQIQQADSMEEREYLRERARRLNGKCFRIEIGHGGGDVELNERRDRIVDSLNAAKSASKYGIIPSIAKTFYETSELLRAMKFQQQDDYSKGIQCMEEALKYPIKQIMWNSGIPPYNLEDYIQTINVIDSVGVAQSCITEASRLANVVISTECIILHDKTYEPPSLKELSKKKEIF